MQICVFGDSIVWGACDSERGGWVTMLRNHFEKSEHEVEVYNLGISDDRTEDVLERITSECEAREPSLIIFAVGINDTCYLDTKDNQQNNIMDFAENVSSLIGKAKKFTEDIIFVGINLVDEEKTKLVPYDTEGKKKKYYDNDNIKIYNSVLKKITDKNNLLFVDVGSIIKKEDLSDGLHPNTQGHGKIFYKVKEVLESNF